MSRRGQSLDRLDRALNATWFPRGKAQAQHQGPASQRSGDKTRHPRQVVIAGNVVKGGMKILKEEVPTEDTLAVKSGIGQILVIPGHHTIELLKECDEHLHRNSLGFLGALSEILQKSMSIRINSEGCNERLDGLLELCEVQSRAHREGVVHGLPLCEGLTIQHRVECGKEAIVAKGFGTNLFENACAMEHNVSQSDLETVQVQEIHLLHCPCVINVLVSPMFGNGEEILKSEAGSECLIHHGTNVSNGWQQRAAQFPMKCFPP